MAQLRRIARALFRLIVFAVALAVVGYGYLQTAPGRKVAARYLEKAAGDALDMKVEIDGLTGRVPQRMSVSELTVSDGTGPWLRARDVAVQWKPLSVLRGPVTVDELAAAKVDVQRRPVRNAGAAESPGADTGAAPNIILKKLDLTSVSLSEAVAGRPVTVAVLGEAVIEGPRRVRSQLRIERLDGGTGVLELTGTYDQRAATLDLAATLTEDAGGVVQGLLGQDDGDPVRVELTGTGPTKEWRARLKADAGATGSLEATLTADAQARTLSAEGLLETETLWPDALAPLSGVPTQFTLRGGTGNENPSLTLTHGRAVAGNVELTFDGSLDGDAINGTLSLVAREELNPLLAPVHVAALRASGTLEGPWDRLAFDIETQAQKPAINDRSLTALLGDTAGVTTVGVFIPSTNTLTLERGEVHGTHADATVTGNRVQGGESYQWNGSITLNDVSAVDELREVLNAGRAAIAFDVRDGTASLRLTGTDIRSAPLVLDTALGSEPRVEIENLVWADLHTVPVRWTLSGENIDAAGALTLHPDSSALAGQYTVDIESLEPYSEALGRPAAGALYLEGKIDGPVADPGATFEATARALTVDRFVADELHMQAQVHATRTGPNGTAALSAPSPLGQIDARTTFALANPDVLTLNALQVRRGDATITGDLTVALDSGRVDGRLTGSIPELEQWNDVLPVQMGGAFDWTASLFQAGERQHAKLSGSGSALSAVVREGNVVQVGALTVEAEGSLGEGAALGTAAITASDVSSGAYTVQAAVVQAGATKDGIDLRLELDGTDEQPLHLEAQGAVASRADGRVMSLHTLTGHVAQQPISLSEPTTFTQTDHTVTLTPLALRIGEASLSAAGEIGAETADLTLTARDLPTSALSLIEPAVRMRGRVHADMRVQGATDNPRGTIHAWADDLRTDDSDVEDADMPRIGMDLRAELLERRLRVSGDVTGLADTTIGLDGEGPLHATLLPWSIAWPEDELGTATLDLDGELAALWAFVPIDPHRLTGRVHGAVHLSGTRAVPELTGTVSVREGRYEHLVTGAVLTNVEADFEAADSRLDIVRMSGADPGGGSVSGSGVLDFQAGAAERITLSATLDRATLVRRDELTTTTNGTLNFVGGGGKGALTGTIESDVVEARVVNELPPEVIELEVEELHAPERSAAADERVTVTSADVVALDIGLTLPRRVFLRGRGLDSEWAGDLHVGGTLAEPTISGVLRPVRGTFTFAGARFELQEGTVTFQGGESIDPMLDLTAEYQASDITATLRMRGPASALDISLSSRPVLPQDEILSRVLFNKSAGSLSPLEAVQLADAVSTLSGSRIGTAGVFDFARGVLGVDVFRADTDEENGATFMVGRYIGDRLFIGLEQGTRARSTGVTAEVAVTKSITIEGDVGQTRGSGIGIKWKRNY